MSRNSKSLVFSLQLLLRVDATLARDSSPAMNKQEMLVQVLQLVAGAASAMFFLLVEA